MVIKPCRGCQTIIPVNGHRRYCDTCRIKSCKTCKKTFIIKPATLSYGRNCGIFCSIQCRSVSQKGRVMPHELGTKWRIEHKRGITLLCSFCGKETYRFPRFFKKRTKVVFCNQQCFIKWSKSSSNPNWGGDNYPENKRLRNSARYKKWRKSIWERDSYTCQICKIKGGKITADHIKSWCMYPELRFELSNGRTLCFDGRTLCFDCHRKTNTWGVKAKYQNIYATN